MITKLFNFVQQLDIAINSFIASERRCEVKLRKLRQIQNCARLLGDRDGI
jgi:hypothetical protein